VSFSRNDIIGKKRPVKVQKAEVPEWGGEVYVRKLSGAECELWDAIRDENDGHPANSWARLAVMVASDEHGNRVFTDADAAVLGNDPAHTDAIIRIINLGSAFNQQRAGDLEEAKKNSDNGQPV
jgi:hypothetical protein